MPAPTSSPPLRLDHGQRRRSRSAWPRTSRCSRPACAAPSRPAPGNRRGSGAMTRLQRLRPAGRSADDDHVDRGGAAAAPAERCSMRAGGASDRRCIGARGRRLDLLDQLLGDLEQPVGRERRRLLNEIDGAGVERGEHLFAGAAGDADDEDRHRPDAPSVLRTKATPSIAGMFRSQVTTSGLSSAIISSASAPSRAVPTTSMNGLRESICLTTLRTYAESSTTTTRTMSVIELRSFHRAFLDVHECARRPAPVRTGR